MFIEDLNRTVVISQGNSSQGVVVLNSNNPLPIPTNLQFNWQATPSIIEAQEGKLVLARNVFLDTTSPIYTVGGNSAGANVTITNASGETYTLRIDKRIMPEIVGQTKPTGSVSIFGVLGQFDISAPYTSGYQIIPTRSADIIPVPEAPSPLFPGTINDTAYTLSNLFPTFQWAGVTPALKRGCYPRRGRKVFR